MNFRQYNSRDEPEINLIPFIDVLLVIVIFLMISTTFQRNAELKVNLPSASGAVVQNRSDEILIVINARNEYSINGRLLPTMERKQLSQQLAEQLVAQARVQNLNSPVINIYADGNANHQAVVNAMEAARLAGYVKVVFTTRK